MSGSQPESGPGALIEALNVPGHARRGFVTAAIVTVTVFVFFITIPDAQRSPLLYITLSFVLFVSLGGLLTAVFTVVSAVRLARSSP